MNIFVIEDEPPILREIIAVIQSFHEDYKIIGKAQNGQEAMAFLQQSGEQVDVMITDIQIPVMNGLDLISYAQKNFPHILSLILTGFTSFDYAKQAIHYGAFGYLLKPIDETELHDQLQKAYARKCLEYIHGNPVITPEEASPETPVAFTESGCQIALLSVSSVPVYASQYNELFPDIWKKLDISALFEGTEDLKDHYWIIDGLTLAEKIVLFLAPQCSEEQSSKTLADILRPLTTGKIPVTIAIDAHFHGVRSVHRCILDLRKFLSRRIRLEHSALFFYEKSSENPAENYTFDFRPYYTRLSRLFVQKNIPVFDAELRNYIRAVKKNDLPTVTIYRQLQDLLHGCIVSADLDLPSSILDIPTTVSDILVLSDSYRSLYENLHSIFSSLFEALLKEEKILTDKAQVLLKADVYIRDHYTQPINTKSVAEQFGFTPAYLSKIFREYKHITPADYIIRLRIDKAKELFILHPDFKIKDVAAFVGYEDSLYFSKVFKKDTGMSPKQFLDNLK